MKTEENDPHLFVSRQSKAWAEFRRRLAESGVSAGQKVLGKAIGRMAGARRAHAGAKGKRERQKRNPGRSSNVPGNFDGAPGRIRTHDPLVRSQVLYPTELLAHDLIFICGFEMVRQAGFEPTTPWFVARYSIQLSYWRTIKFAEAKYYAHFLKKARALRKKIRTKLFRPDFGAQKR